MLRGRRKRFVELYLGECGGNASEAARRAGYLSPGSEGWRLLRDPEVAEGVRAGLAAVGITKERVLLRLAEQAFADLGEFLLVDADGRLSFRVLRDDSRDTEAACEWPPKWRIAGASHLLKSVSFSRAHGVRVELQDSQKALLAMGRYLRMWDGEVDEEGNVLGEFGRAIVESARRSKERCVPDGETEGDSSGAERQDVQSG